MSPIYRPPEPGISIHGVIVIESAFVTLVLIAASLLGVLPG